MLDSPKNLDTPDQPLQTDSTDKSAQAKKEQAVQEIKTTMSALTRESEFTEVIRIPNIGTTVTFYAEGKGYPAKVTNIVESDKGPMITVEADPSYPGPNKKITCTLDQFNMLAGTKKSTETADTNTTDKIVDTKVPDSVLDSINDLVVQETLSRFDGKEIPQSIIDGQLVIIKSELDEVGHADSFANISREVSAMFAEHNAEITAKKPKTLTPDDPTKISDNARRARANELEKNMQMHPELEGSIAALDKKVQALLASKEWSNDTQLDPLQQITAPNSPVTAYLKVLDEAQDLPGMTPAILEALKNKWGKEINRQAELAPQLIKLSSIINEQLAKTETLIDNKGLQEIASTIAAIPRLSKQQKDLLLSKASKQVVTHNESVQAIQAARIALENQLKPNTTVDRATALATIDAIANLSDEERAKLKSSFNDRIDAFENAVKNPSITPPPLPSKAAKIEVKDAEIDDAPEVAISDPDFNKKVDYLDETASKLLQSMSNSSASDLIDADAFTKLLVAELKKQNLKTDSKEAVAWLSVQQETAYQINQGIESINQENETKRKALEKLKLENERIHETTANCHQDIDTLLDSPDCSTLEEIAAIQAKINTLPDSPEKTDLQNRLTEIEAHDQAVLKADELIQNALAAKVETSTIDLKIAIQTLLPATAGEHYWKVAEELIDEHNKQFQNLSEPETGTEDQTKIDALVNECNDKVSAILISGELASIADIAALQTKIDSITDTDIKTGLQKNISELLEYNQALKQADTLMETALATKTLIDGGDLKKNLEKLIPTAIEQYWNAAEEIITEHNTSLSVATSPSPDAVATVVDVPVVTPPQTPDATIAQAPETVISTPPVTPDQTPAAAVTVVSGTPIVTPDTAPQADVLGVAPVDTTIAPPVDVLNKVDATPLSAEQIAKRDEMFSLIEKNLILTEEEKGQMMVKVMELLRTANRGTNVMDELQKLMTSQDRHQEIQRQLNEKSPIFAMIVQDAVQSALNTNDLNYKSNEAEYQKMLSDLPTDAAKKAMQAVYDAAIGDKTLRGDLKAIQAKVEQVLTNQANFSDARNESLLPLFKRMNVIVKTGLSRESQVLGSQTVAPDVGQWEAPPTDEQPESLRDKAKRKFLELFDRIRGKKTETVDVETDTTNDLDEAYLKTPTEIIDNLVEGNADLTTAEKADLKATALELLEKGTDISKTVEKLKATLAERSRVNREISALVLNAPELSKQMYFALSAALNDEMSAPKRTEALTQWQSFADQLPTDRAKAAVKAVYQEALKNKALRSDVNALEEKIADKLASTGIDDREKALNSLINTLGSEINRAISTRKPSETVVDQAPAVTEAAVVAAAEVLTDAPKTTVENKDAKLNQALTDRIISVNLNSEGKKRDVTPQEFFGSDMDQLIKTMEGENDEKLNTELKAIRQLLVDSKPGVMISTEATDRLKAALSAKYPEVLENIMGYINIHIQEHDIRTAMQAEINAKGTELKAKIDTLSSADVSAEIKALHQKFASRINPFGVDQALFPLNDALQERVHNTEAAAKEIDQLWQRADEPSLALNTVATILSKNQLDNTIQLSLIEFARKIGPIFSKPGEISKEDLGNIIFQIIPQTTNIPPALRSALVNKMKVMVNTHNKTVGQNPQQQVA